MRETDLQKPMPALELDQVGGVAELETMVARRPMIALGQARALPVELAQEQKAWKTQEPQVERSPMVQVPKPGPKKKPRGPFELAREGLAEHC
ncbi:MAG: hypothetical protein DMG38_18120 [Acidobacteria bacterium]|nr:MAG: hypothetical protein DMG38_18120 [Acidobacteriota bacterium]